MTAFKVSPLVYAHQPRSGDEIDASLVYDAYAAVNTVYEEVIAALVNDVHYWDDWSGSLADGDRLQYRLPSPRGEGMSAITVIVLAARVGSDNCRLEINGEVIEVDDPTPTEFWTSFDVNDNPLDHFDLTIEVTGTGTSELRVYAIYAYSPRDRALLPDNILDNDARPIDLDTINPDWPLTTARQNDAHQLLRVTHAQQFRSAIAAAAWAPGENGTGVLAALQSEIGIEVPCSASQRSATLTVWASAMDDGGVLFVTVDGERKRIDCPDALEWYSETWTVPTAQPGVSRPNRITVLLDQNSFPDVQFAGICASWSGVLP
jgi:hypothetical protein